MFFKEADAYDALAGNAPTLYVGKLRGGKEKGWILALGGRWIPTTLESVSLHNRAALWIGATKAGMSGSQILNGRGEAVGVVVIGQVGCTQEGETGPHPILMHHLPAWLLAKRGARC